MPRPTRRAFLRTTAALTVGRLSFAAPENRPLRMGLIGCGWYGMVDLKAALQVGGVEFIALCDVDSAHLDSAIKETAKLQGGQAPQGFKHYQDLLATPGLEAVIIASPPQWHALQFLASLEKGLDIYCEKPLAYDIREGQAMLAAAQQSDRIIQIGFQRRQSQAIREVRDYIQSGKAGKIVQADAQIHYTAGTADPTPQEPPASLDWDLWCGPAPKIPYSPQAGHFNWRLEKTTGHGHLVDWGIHWIDACRYILRETTPHFVTAAGGLYQLKGKITTPDTLTAHFEFDSCPVVWRHRIWGSAEYNPEINNGILFFGEKETVFVTDQQWITIPRDPKQDRTARKSDTNMGKNHMANFLECVRTRQQPDCPAEEGYQSTVTVQLAMIAYESGVNVKWDREQQRILDPAAAQLMKREYRPPWKHPYTE